MADVAATTGTRFLDPRVLARVGNLDFLARRVVDGFISGLHRTLHLGVSTDFAEHRAYVPGDDLRRLDWRVYGRTDRLYVKTFEAETNADIVCLLDVSGSMDFATDTLSKFDYARFLAASLVHLCARQRDRVSLLTFNDDIGEWVPPAVKHRDTILRALEVVKAGGHSDLLKAALRLAALLKRRSIVLLISDLYLDADPFAQVLDTLGAAGHEIIVMQVLDPGEQTLRLPAHGVLEDLETGERVALNPAVAIRDYARLMDEHLRGLSKTCSGRGIEYVRLDTAMPLDQALFEFLSRRAKLLGRR